MLKLPSKFTQKNFEKWLSEKDSEDVAGFPDDVLHCPLANFLRTLTKREYVLGSASYCLMNGNEMESLPVWAKNFIWYAFKLSDINQVITVKQCLQILEEMKNATNSLYV